MTVDSFIGSSSQADSSLTRTRESICNIAITIETTRIVCSYIETITL